MHLVVLRVCKDTREAPSRAFGLHRLGGFEEPCCRSFRGVREALGSPLSVLELMSQLIG